MENIYNIDQLEEYLSTLPLGTEAVEKITEFAKLQDNRIDWQARRVNTAAQLLGHDLINEAMYDD